MDINKSPRTFISYSRANKDFALKLAQELRISGFNIWLDLLDIPTGARWDDEVERALTECEIFMVILTPASSQSDNVKDEISFAIDMRKRILPVLLENATVPLRLRRFQYVDFTSKSYEEGVEIAKKLLNNLIEQSSVPGTEYSEASRIWYERKKWDESDRLTDRNVEYERPVPFPPAVKPTTEQKSIVPERKSIPEGLLIGLVLVSLLIVSVIAFTVSGGINIRELFSRPTLIPVLAPIILDASEARKLLEDGDGKGIFSTAREQYTPDELNSFLETSKPIPVTLENPAPIIVGYDDAWCATTQDILQDNIAYINIVIKLDDKTASESNFVDEYYINTDGWKCFNRRIVISGWASGTYFISQKITLTQKVNNGLEDKGPFTNSQSYIVTIP